MSYLSLYTGAEVVALLQRVTESVGQTGTVELVEGEAFGEVTGLALTFTPTKVLLTIEVPDDSSDPYIIFVVTFGTPTVNGFAYMLTPPPDRPGYKLHYELKP